MLGSGTMKTISLSDESYARLRIVMDRFEKAQEAGVSQFLWRPSCSKTIEFLTWFYENAHASVEAYEQTKKTMHAFHPATSMAGRPKRHNGLTVLGVATEALRSKLLQAGERRDPTPEELKAFLKEHYDGVDSWMMTGNESW